MKHARSYPEVIRQWYRPIEHECPECHRRLREAMTLSRRTVITLQGVIKLTHAGYRCPDGQCAGHQRTYRSVEADALALPRMTYGLDIVLLVGRLHLSEHRTVDEIHQEVLKRLEPLGVRIARREILYLFEAYCTLLRAASLIKDDQDWLAQVQKNGGIIVAVDGIQPEKGNETVYLVRDALTSRVLAAENVLSSETEVIKELLRPVVDLGVRVLGTITDAQESELLAVEQLWPNIPHQVCQFHALRDASKPAFEADRKVKTAMRKTLQPKVRAVRKQLKRDIPKGAPGEATQLAVLDDYATGILTALNRDGLAPFDFAAVQAGEDLDEIAASLERLEKKGQPPVRSARKNWHAGPVIVAERSSWREQLKQVKRMRQWVLEAEHILDGSWAKAGECVSNQKVGQRFDRWRKKLARSLSEATLSPVEQECLEQFVQVLSNLRPYLIQCYDRKEFPRTNNEMERSIRGLKTQYRRISGRKNWNNSLLRYGRCVAYAAWWEQDAAHRQQLEQRAGCLDRARWRELRQETKVTAGERLKRFRFRHKRQQFLDSLEERWAAASPTCSLP